MMNDYMVSQLLLSAAKKGQAMADFIYSLDKKVPGHPQHTGKKARKKMAAASRRKNRK